MAENYNYCHVVGKTDVGRKRAANEDNMYNLITQNGLVSIVCDGMGGHVGGATASRIAVSTIASHLSEVYYDDPRIAIGESIDKANKAILQEASAQPDLKGMGSTCVLLLVRDGKVYIGHVGDSRIYLIRSKRIIQLTKDHSYVQMLVDSGQLTPEQAEQHPRKNEITNALGIPNMTPATVAEDAIIPEAGDCFVLCSDGLSGMVSDHDICKVIGRQAEMTAQERVDRLVDMANENGGVDNITIQLVEFSVTPGASEPEKKFPLWTKLACAVPVVVGLAVGAYFCFKDKKPKDTGDQKGSSETVVHGGQVDLGNTTLPGKPVEYKKGAQIVEFEFTDSTLTQKRRGYENFVQTNVEIDPSSLVVVTEGVTVKYNNSLLEFTDEAPADSKVVYTFTSPDGTKSYTYTIKVSVPVGAPSAAISGFNADGGDEGAGADAGEGVTPPADCPAEITLEPVKFEYTELASKGTRLILNYSVAPFVTFSSLEQKLATQERIGEVLVGDITCPDGWEVSNKKNQNQLIFIFKGPAQAESYKFTIPCKVKDSDKRILVTVELVKRVEADPEGVVPADGAPADETPADEIPAEGEKPAEGEPSDDEGTVADPAAETEQEVDPEDEGTGANGDPAAPTLNA